MSGAERRSASALASFWFLVGALLGGRWRRTQARGGALPLLVGLAAGITLGVSLIARLHANLSPAAFDGRMGELGLGLWGAWLASAAILRVDLGWHVPLRPWAIRPGFWAGYTAAVALAPLTAVVAGGFVVTLVAAVLALRPSAGGALLLVAALSLLFFATLRVTHLALVLLRPGGAVVERMAGLAIALGLATWNWLAGGLVPLHWVGQRAGGVAELLGLLLAVCAADGWLTRRVLLQGLAGRQREVIRTGALGAGAGPAAALRRAALIGWLRHANIDFALAFGALWLPIFALLAPGTMQPGMPIAFCGFALLFLSLVRGNLLGIDGAGTWRHASAAVAPWQVLLQRGRVLDWIEIVVLAPTLALSVAQRPGGWTGIVATVAFAVSTISSQGAAGLLLSCAYPEPVERSDFRSGMNATGGNWILLGTMIWTVGFLLAFLRTWPGAAAWIWPAALAGVCLLIREAVVRRLKSQLATTWPARVLARMGAVLS